MPPQRHFQCDTPRSPLLQLHQTLPQHRVFYVPPHIAERIGTIVSAFLYPLLPAHCPHFLFADISLHRIPNTPCPWQSDRSPLPDTCSYTPGSEIPSFLKICRQSAHRQCRQLCCFVSSFSHCARKTPHFSDKIFNKGTAVNRRRSKFPKCCDMRCRAISLIVSKPVSRKYLIILFHQTVSCYFRNYTCGRN